MWGSRRALALCENASVAQNDGISQDGMTCTVIPTVLRALTCCCTVVAHGADWERACSLRIVRPVVLQDGVHSCKRAPVKCCTERTGQSVAVGVPSSSTTSETQVLASIHLHACDAMFTLCAREGLHLCAPPDHVTAGLASDFVHFAAR